MHENPLRQSTVRLKKFKVAITCYYASTRYVDVEAKTEEGAKLKALASHCKLKHLDFTLKNQVFMHANHDSLGMVIAVRQ